MPHFLRNMKCPLIRMSRMCLLPYIDGYKNRRDYGSQWRTISWTRLHRRRRHHPTRRMIDRNCRKSIQNMQQRQRYQRRMLYRTITKITFPSCEELPKDIGDMQYCYVSCMTCASIVANMCMSLKRNFTLTVSSHNNDIEISAVNG